MERQPAQPSASPISRLLLCSLLCVLSVCLALLGLVQNLAQFNARLEQQGSQQVNAGRHMSVMMPAGRADAAAMRRMTMMNQPMIGSAPIEMPAVEMPAVAAAAAAAAAAAPPNEPPAPSSQPSMQGSGWDRLRAHVTTTQQNQNHPTHEPNLMPSEEEGHARVSRINEWKATQITVMNCLYTILLFVLACVCLLPTESSSAARCASGSTHCARRARVRGCG